MKQIRALFENWMHTNKDSKRIMSKWDKVTSAIDAKDNAADIEPLIIEYAEATEERGFKAGFRAAMELWKECS